MKKKNCNNDDEAALALDMAGDMATKLDAILAKLSKLDSIEATLNAVSNKLAKVESEESKLKEDVRNTETKVEQMDGGLKWINDEVQQVQVKIKELDLAKEELHTKHLYAEAYSRRENLTFFGLEERGSSTDTKEDTRGILFDFIENTLGIEIGWVNLYRENQDQLLHVSFDSKTERSC